MQPKLESVDGLGAWKAGELEAVVLSSGDKASKGFTSRDE
jgi:hypothetical protein